MVFQSVTLIRSMSGIMSVFVTVILRSSKVFSSFRSMASHSVINLAFPNYVGTYPSKSNLVLQASGMDHSRISIMSSGVNLSESVPFGKRGKLLLSLPTAATVFLRESSLGFRMRRRIHCFWFSNALKGNTLRATAFKLWRTVSSLNGIWLIFPSSSVSVVLDQHENSSKEIPVTRTRRTGNPNVWWIQLNIEYDDSESELTFL